MGTATTAHVTVEVLAVQLVISFHLHVLLSNLLHMTLYIHVCMSFRKQSCLSDECSTTDMNTVFYVPEYVHKVHVHMYVFTLITIIM